MLKYVNIYYHIADEIKNLMAGPATKKDFGKV